MQDKNFKWCIHDSRLQHWWGDNIQKQCEIWVTHFFFSFRSTSIAQEARKKCPLAMMLNSQDVLGTMPGGTTEEKFSLFLWINKQPSCNHSSCLSSYIPRKFLIHWQRGGSNTVKLVGISTRNFCNRYMFVPVYSHKTKERFKERILRNMYYCFYITKIILKDKDI